MSEETECFQGLIWMGGDSGSCSSYWDGEFKHSMSPKLLGTTFGENLPKDKARMMM